MLSLPIEKIYLQGNDARIMKITKDNPFLKELHIANLANQIFSIADVLANLSNLSTLSINCGITTTDDANAIANFVANSQLLKLELSHCNILTPIINSMTQSHVQTLNLRHHFIKQEEAIALANMLERLPLTKLSFIKCSFENGVLALIADSIKKSTLKTLIMDGTHFKNDAVAIIADCIANSDLIKLSLRSTLSAENGSSMIFDAIKQSSLRTLNICDCSILNDFDTINYLILHQGFVKFKFDGCAFNAKEMLALLNSIQKNSSLEHISFNSVSVHTCNSKRLITKICALLINPRFKSFDLDYESLFDIHLKRIMDAIMRSSIVSLKFSECYPRDANMIVIRKLLENYHFEKLKLEFLEYNDECIKQILPLVQCSTITKFSVDSAVTRASDELQNAIELTLQIRNNMARSYSTKSARL